MKKDFQNFMFTNTEICVDLKLVTRKSGATRMGTNLNGNLVHDKEYHYTFTEEASERKDYPRNPHVFIGRFITITRWKDGSLHPNFRPIPMEKNFSAFDYARGVANELLWAFESLLGKEDGK
jgi:hypothetical protein